MWRMYISMGEKGRSNRKARSFLFSSRVKIGKKINDTCVTLLQSVIFFCSLSFSRNVDRCKNWNGKINEEYTSFFFFACKLTNESYVTRRTVARPNLTLLANTSYLPPHPPSVHSLYSCCPCIKPLSVDWTAVLQTQAVWWMNTTRYIVDTSIYRRGLYYYINNFELPRLAKHSSIIQLSNSRMKEDEFSVPRVRN